MKTPLVRLLVLASLGAIPIGVMLALPLGVWADFSGLPGHPLIVHSVVVLLPVTSIWVLIASWKGNVFEKTGNVVYGLSVLSAVGVIAAKSSGDSLSAAVGLPNDHADAGNRLVGVSIALAGSVLVMWAIRLLLAPKSAVVATQVLASLIAIVVLPLTYVAGHTGAESVWKEDYAKAQEPISRESVTFSMDEVAKRNTAEQCWTVVNDVVYNMTTFIKRHPAGSKDIIDMCGKDASDDFLGEHEGQGEPEKWLETLKIGALQK
jgi:hypothetical protein